MPNLNVTDRDETDQIISMLNSVYIVDTPNSTLPEPIIRDYTINAPIYENEGTRVLMRQSVTVGTNVTSEIRDIISNVENTNFLNHSTRILTPEMDTAAAGTALDGTLDSFNYNNYSSDAFSYYNLRFEEYENYTVDAEEKSLPNFLIGALYQRSYNQEQEELYNMFGSIPGLGSTLLLAPATPINNYEFDGQFLGTEDYDAALRTDYFRIFYENRLTSSLQYVNANQHIYLDYLYNLDDSSQIGNCPFYNRIRLPRKTRTIQQPPMFATEENIQTGTQTSPLVISMEQSGMTDFLLKTFRTSQSFMRTFDVNGAPVDLKVYDLIGELEAFGISTALKGSDEIYLRTADTTHLSETENPFLFYFYKLISLGKIRSLTKSNMLKLEDLMSRQDHRKEHIGFKVVKRREGRTSPIQTFYFLGRKGLQDFIDTQIRFDTVYTYDVVGMFAIYGSEYSYENFSFGLDGFTFDFINKPSLKVVEVPLASHTLRVVEPPPITPEVQFYNQKTEKNKLKIRLEHQDGNLVNEYSQRPMREFGGNSDYISRLKQYFSSDKILVQSGKTSDGVYEIYRVEDPPTKYSDFEGNLIATVQSSVIYNNNQRSKNVMFVDQIKHQKKYYYMFRVLTHQRNPSETSEIYEIEMYEDADETFLLVNMYNFPEPDYSDHEIQMRKYLQIIPNFEHTFIDESAFTNMETATGDNIQNIRLGLLPDDDSLWSYNDKQKKYLKLRLESKNSGRKLDLNLLFKINKPNN